MTKHLMILVALAYYWHNNSCEAWRWCFRWHNRAVIFHESLVRMLRLFQICNQSKFERLTSWRFAKQQCAQCCHCWSKAVVQQCISRSVDLLDSPSLTRIKITDSDYLVNSYHMYGTFWEDMYNVMMGHLWGHKTLNGDVGDVFRGS